MINITLELSTNNEGTAAPWWAIIDPKQLMWKSPREVASMITGPFFSREAAQKQLDSTRYNYSEHAVVYCFSGHNSPEYKKAVTESKLKEKAR